MVLLLLVDVVLLLLVDAAAGALKAGNVKGAAEVDDDTVALPELNVKGAVDADEDGTLAGVAPNMNDGSEDVLLAAEEDDDNAGVDVSKVSGVTGFVVVAAALSLRLSLPVSVVVVVVGLANGLALCLLSSSSSTVRRLRLNDEDERVDASMSVAEEANGAMKGVEEEDKEEEAEVEDDEDEVDGLLDDEEEPLMMDELAGGLKVGTAGNSTPLLRLCTPRSPPSSLSLSVSLTVVCCTLLVLFLSSLSSATSSFSSLPFSFSLTTTAGNCKLFTAVIAPPPVPPTPKPSFRVGSNRPRREERERGEADVAAVWDGGEGRARDEMMGAGEGRLSRLVVSSGVRSSDASMRCAV